MIRLEIDFCVKVSYTVNKQPIEKEKSCPVRPMKTWHSLL